MPSLGSYGPVGGVVWPSGQAALSRNQFPNELFQVTNRTAFGYDGSQHTSPSEPSSRRPARATVKSPHQQKPDATTGPAPRAASEAGSSATRWASTFGIGHGGEDGRFPPSHQSLIAHAADPEAPGSAAALAELCRRYWYPLYAWLRHSGKKRELAKDLTQGFFARLLEKEWLADFDPDKGKFRTFLLVALNRYAGGEWRRDHAKKRGGGIQHVSLNFDDGEERYLNTAAENETPDKHYEKQWAINLLGRVTEALREEYTRRGMGHHYEVLKDALQWNSQSAPYAELGQELGLDANAVKQAVLRMRRQYRRLLTEEIQSTLETDDPQIVQEELASLIAVFRT
jgi:RNA polymerase sigma factor (sigma-70 family)